MMKKILLFLFLSILTIGIVGCDDKIIDPVDDGITRIILLVNGNLGDKSFFDSAVLGIEQIDDLENVEASYIEMGTDSSKWESTLRTVSNQDYDLIIVGTWQMSEQLQRVSRRFPDKRYIIFDSEVHEDRNDEYLNVHSILFKQNQASFLAGYMAAKLSTTKKIGFVGGQKIDTINDFAVGFIEGAELAGANVTIYNSYIGSFDNSALAKSLAETQYNSGVDIIFQAASQAGLGVIDAAKSKNKYVIGVDTNQFDYFKDTDATKANLIVSSVLKKVDQVLVSTVNQYLAGELDFGILIELGLAEGIVGLAKNTNYESIVSQTVRDEIDQIEAQIINGSIIVSSAYELDINQVNAILDRNKP